MRLTLRWRIFVTLIPLLLLLVILGSAAAVLLHGLGGRIDAILRENYRSVIYMERVGESLERIDSSFQFALVGQEKQARQQYEANWKLFRDNIELERQNITLPGEAELVARLSKLEDQYWKRGQEFYSRPADSPLRRQDYFRPDGQPGVLFALFKEIKTVAAEITRLNQENMEQASHEASEAALQSLLWFAVGLIVAVVLAGLLAWRTVRAILQPLHAVTESALGISAGNLDQVVPVLSNDELGQLAQAFNLMARHLRDYRQSQSAQLLRAQQTSQATIDSFPDPIVVIDAEGNVERANPASRRLLGVITQHGAGAPWHPPEPLREPLAEALVSQRDYLPQGFDKVFSLGSGGRERMFLPRVLTIRDPHGSVLGAAVLLQDVTRLRLLDQVKSNLVATASHELKTPLTSIRLAVHLLLEEAAGPLTAKQTELLVDARENSERLLAMVNNLLDLARLEQGRRQLDIHPVSPGILVEEAANLLRPRAADKGVEVVVRVAQGLPEVPVDAARLGIALGNLLDNALAYTNAGGSITLSAAAGAETVTLAVADTGIGIPQEHLPHVFEKFFRVPGQSRGGGTGLGLAVVHEIVMAHGGTITCESQVDVGTTFRISLPLVQESPVAS